MRLMIKHLIFAIALLSCELGIAQPSVPFMPSWQARHHLQLLVDRGGLQITTTHWPLPLLAVQDAMDGLPKSLGPVLEKSKHYVLNELRAHRWQGYTQLQWRNKTDGAVGFGENYSPGSSIKVTTSATEFGPNDLSVAFKLGMKVEQNPNSAQTQFSGWGKEGKVQPKFDDTALVLEGLGINWQLFAKQNWWGPGWQSSLINGNNIPAWNGFGIQRSQAKPSESNWLSWLGPWNGELFFAVAQDPIVAANQPDGYVMMGSRLTFKPFQNLEIGLSRAIQAAGSGRPSSPHYLIKNLAGLQTHTNVQDLNQDSANQIAGYDFRLTCPYKISCAVYAQWMGEDASGQSKLPNQFMSLSGFEFSSPSGDHRFYSEFANTYVWSLPWNHGERKNGTGSSYRNWAYPQGFTNGGRWIGSSFGGDSRVFTLGWLDIDAQRVIKFHTGRIGVSQGVYAPNVSQVGGAYRAASVTQIFKWKTLTITPELMYSQLDGVGQRTDLRGGLTLGIPLGSN
jgi:hypothetical protein